ncbi:c-type cytochrome biogenesis protein CcsB [Actinotalea sp. K2]|uniref:c-type cytochrome biogenesis protein CcsB n=1 Tax=Actinotalea sp. K2 TaxID=2939438 RepID=UPI002016F664|nr:c-type cytochrome biogenesis protein CcsB [Actinotalea sp. K2]MCL3863054.1 c-type cytochrome biogenesis protein CcsB [Actinotalea sp. K2]
MSLGELSTLLVWGATAAYAIGLVAFAVDLARLADGAARPVRAGAVANARAGGGPVVPSATGPAVGDPSGPEGVVTRAGRRAVGIAMATTGVGAVLHVAGTVLRGVAAERVPWANMYEFALVGSLVAVLTFLALCRGRDLRFLGTIVIGIAVLALGLGLTAFYVPADAVEPALQSYWLVIHVSIAVIATGLFTVAFAVSTLQLLKDSRASGSSRLAGSRWRMLDALPPAAELEGLSFRINAVGFVLWTFTVMAGAIWAEQAWARYWGWDPKEVWSFVVWVVYAAYLHARTTRGWSGRRAAWFVVVGYATVIFNFTGVNLLFDGLHSYSGL